MISRLVALFTVAALATFPAAAQKKYDPGASDTSIKIGNTAPYSGPASSYSTLTKTLNAYIRMVNEKGGVNGRKIDFITLDDAYTPPKTVEQVRRLVEHEQVLALAAGIGTPPTAAVIGYQNARKVPHLFMSTGAEKWNDPKTYPLSMPFWPSYALETAIIARHVLENVPNAKIAILRSNDDAGKEFEAGILEGLRDQKSRIVAELTYQGTDPTVDSQVIKLAASGANVFFNFTHPKYTVQAIRKARELGWNPQQFIVSPSTSVKGVLEVAGLDNATGVMATQYLKDPADSRWQGDPEVKEWSAFMDKYFPEGSKSDVLNAYGYALGYTLVHTLKMAGDNLTRENLMLQAQSLKNVRAPMLLPGILLNTSPTDHAPVEQMQLARFNGKTWELVGSMQSRAR